MELLLSILLISLSAHLPTFPIVEHTPYLSGRDIRAERVAPQEESTQVPVKKDVKSLGPRLSAQSAIVVDAKSGAVLFDKLANKKHSMASIVKMMTALVFLEQNPNLADRIKMKEEDNREGGDSFIKPGESAALLSYLRASLLGSANNATIVLSRSAGFSQEEFIQKMNEKARNLGMLDTVFTEPTGLDPQNISTARDIVRLLSEAGKNKRIREILGTYRSTIRVYPRNIIRYVLTTDHLIGTIIPVEYGKTGYLDESLFNLATVVSTRQGNELNIVVLGSETDEERVQDAKNLAVWAERVYEWE